MNRIAEATVDFKPKLRQFQVQEPKPGTVFRCPYCGGVYNAEEFVFSGGVVVNGKIYIVGSISPDDFEMQALDVRSDLFIYPVCHFCESAIGQYEGKRVAAEKNVNRFYGSHPFVRGEA